MFIVTTIIYICLPIFAIGYTLTYFAEVGNREMRETFGALYEDKAIEKGKRVLYITVYFLIRRLFMVYLVV